MTAASDAIPGSSPATARPRTRPLFWSVRRELWENHALWIAPLSVAAVIIFGVMVGVFAPHRLTMHNVHRTSSENSQTVTQSSTTVSGSFNLPPSPPAVGEGPVTTQAVVKVPPTPAQRQAMAQLPFNIVAVALVGCMFLVAVFYCLGAMYNERRDRSILFWKSLPVPDLTTVLAKALVPLAILPVITFAVTVGTQMIMLLVGLVDLSIHGKSTDPATSIPLAEMAMVLLYGLTALTLWWAPVYAWLLLVSGWARRAPFLWAVLPPIALAIAEKIALNTTAIGGIISSRLLGCFDEAFKTPARGSVRPGAVMTLGLDQIDPGKFFSAPGLWVGLIVAAGLLAATVWLRRDREPL